jgi:hypothetical protein
MRYHVGLGVGHVHQHADTSRYIHEESGSVKAKSRVQLSSCQANISKMEFCQPLVKPVVKTSHIRIASITLKVTK